MLQTKPLTNLQLELLQLFRYEVEEDELEEIRSMLVTYFADRIIKDMDDLFAENDWGEEKIEEWENTHMRTPY